MARIKDKTALTGIDSSDRLGIDGTAGLRSFSWTALIAALKSGTLVNISTTLFEDAGEKGAADGYCPLDSDQLVPEANLPQGLVRSINTQTGTTYTLVLADAGAVVEMNNASANVLTVPPNATVAFPLRTKLEVTQYGAGETTIAAGAGVTLRGDLTSAGQYKGFSLYKRATDEWLVIGGTT